MPTNLSKSKISHHIHIPLDSEEEGCLIEESCRKTHGLDSFREI